MSKNALRKATSDPLALRLVALTSLVDHLIAKMQRSGETLREMRIAVALARDSVASTEPTTRVRTRDLKE